MVAKTTKNKKAKGRKFQQDVKRALLGVHPDLQEDDIQSRSMGAGGEDLMLSPLARKYIPFSFECKRQEVFKVSEWFKQTKENAGDYMPALVMKRNNEDALVVLKLDDFIKVIKHE